MEDPFLGEGVPLVEVAEVVDLQEEEIPDQEALVALVKQEPEELTVI